MNNQKMKLGAGVGALLLILVSGQYAFSLSPCQLSLDGDLNGDCKVDMFDFSLLASSWLEDLSGETGAFLPDGIYVASPVWGGVDGMGCGSMTGPCATVNYGIGRAYATLKNYVFVADGVYQENVGVSNGINLWGGFDPITWVRKEAAQSDSVLVGTVSGTHTKTLIANSINTATEVSRFQIKGAEAAQATGNSYAVWIKDCDSDFVLKDNYIYVGRGADGVDGADGIGGINGPDGAGGIGGLNPMGSVVAGEWKGASGTSGEDATAGGSGGSAGGGVLGIFVVNTISSSNKPSLLNNLVYAGRGANGGDGGFGGIGPQEGVGGGGGGGAGGIACGIYTWNVTGTVNYQVYNSFAGTYIGGNGGKGGKSFGNAGGAGIAGGAFNYSYQ